MIKKDPIRSMTFALSDGDRARALEVARAESRTLSGLIRHVLKLYCQHRLDGRPVQQPSGRTAAKRQPPGRGSRGRQTIKTRQGPGAVKGSR